MSSQRGVLGWWAKRSANPGGGDAAFRYNEQSLVQAFCDQQKRIGFAFRVVSIGRDIVIEVNG